MTSTIAHEHVPIYRVVRRDWRDPVDAGFSQLPHVNNRWNNSDFPALYCCCSEAVARAVVRDIFRVTGVDLADLQDAAQPQLTEIHWSGELVDMITETAIVAAGFPPDYPLRSEHSETQLAAILWHQERSEGVLSRSTSLARLGFTDWAGDHPRWSELAIYTDNSLLRPSLLKRRDDLDWLTA